MRRSRITEEQITAVLRERDADVKTVGAVSQARDRRRDVP